MQELPTSTYQDVVTKKQALATSMEQLGWCCLCGNQGGVISTQVVYAKPSEAFTAL